MKTYGCIGKKLTHSFSREIHARLADYTYNLIELSEEEVGAFLQKKDFAAINVTIPYKETVIPYLDSIDAEAAKIGAVNTIVNQNGRLYGYNTDCYGMKELIAKIGIDLTGKKVLILGTGGTSKTARVVASELGAAEILVVSRHAAENGVTITYEEALREHTDAEVIINTTPVGMYPNPASVPIDIDGFAHLSGVVDAVYNPLATNLIRNARERGIPAEGGLYMLVMQAVAAVEHFLDKKIPQSIGDEVFAEIMAEKANIVLIGMPGCGKSTVGKLLAANGFAFVDTDTEVERQCGCSIKDFIHDKGERAFRELESTVVRSVSMESGRIIATGGGVPLREENLRALRQNGRIFFLDAPLSRLCATDDRPLADTREKLAKLYAERQDIYKNAADVIVPAMDTPDDEAAYIQMKRKERIF